MVSSWLSASAGATGTVWKWCLPVVSDQVEGSPRWLETSTLAKHMSKGGTSESQHGTVACGAVESLNNHIFPLLCFALVKELTGLSVILQVMWKVPFIWHYLYCGRGGNLRSLSHLICVTAYHWRRLHSLRNRGTHPNSFSRSRKYLTSLSWLAFLWVFLFEMPCTHGFIINYT